MPDAQVGAERDGQEQPAHALREPVDPQPEEILDRVGHREVLADPGRPVVDQLAPDLEREQGIAERGVVDPPQELARDAQPEPVAQDAADRAEAEWAEFHPLDAVRVERELERRRRPRPAGEEEADPGALEPSRGKREGGGRGGVEPLDVVERDQDGITRRHRTERVEATDADGVGLGCAIGRHGAQQGDIESVKLRWRQACQFLRRHPVEQVDERRKREPRLCIARPGDEHAHAPLPRRLDAVLP